MEIKSGLCVKKNDVSDEGGVVRKTEPLDNRMRISTITALARAIHEQSLGHRSFRPHNIGGSWRINLNWFYLPSICIWTSSEFSTQKSNLCSINTMIPAQLGHLFNTQRYLGYISCLSLSMSELSLFNTDQLRVTVYEKHILLLIKNFWVYLKFNTKNWV